MSFTPFGSTAPPAWAPSDNGLVFATSDPAICTGSVVVNNTGFLHFFRAPVRAPVPYSNLWFGLVTAGVGASTGCFAGVYTPGGLLISTSADIGAQLTGATGMISCAQVGAPFVASPPYVVIAIVTNLATTGAALAKTNALQAMLNVNLAAAAFRTGFQSTALTSLPASVNLSASTVEQGLWCGAS